MNLNIEFPADIENVLRSRAAAAGTDLTSFVRQVVTESIVDPELPSPEKSSSHEEFMAKIRGIIALHPVSHGKMDDSRESIYAGRGE
jgi:hypothetical protein